MSKITVLSYGSGLAEYIGHKEMLPSEYGGDRSNTLVDLAV